MSRAWAMDTCGSLSFKKRRKHRFTKRSPPSVTIIFAENQSPRNLEYQLSSHDRRRADAFEKGQPSLLILTRYNDTARSLRGFFNRRILLWEGHTRTSLEKLVDRVTAGNGDCAALAAAVVAFMADVGKGFSPSVFGNRFEKEARDGCTGKSAREYPRPFRNSRAFWSINPTTAALLRCSAAFRNSRPPTATSQDQDRLPEGILE